MLSSYCALTLGLVAVIDVRLPLRGNRYGGWNRAVL